MNPTNVMINGLPGNVSQVIGKQLIGDDRFSVVPYSFTGPDIDIKYHHIDDIAIQLIPPSSLDDHIVSIKADHGPFICIDFTHPTAVNANAQFYCRHQLPFVMGTTGGDRDKLMDTVTQSTNAAVIAPNMAKQLVGFQAMMAYAAEQFPGLYNGYQLTVRESHQAGKADTSGTAKAMVGYFNKMGIPFSADQIEKERDPERQCNMWGIPTDHLSGHGWHTYTLRSADQSVKFEFTHNINGRDIYGEGTMDAVLFLEKKLAEGARGKVFSMIDVLEAGV
jgi:4-hydroxy-tetrahydrodipicolinate reductase